MANNSVQAFYDALAKNEELQKELLHRRLPDKIKDEIWEAVIEVAEQYGYHLTKEDLKAFEDLQGKEPSMNASSDWDQCFCVVGGGGYNHTEHYACACVLDGGGKSDADGCGLWCMIAGTLGYGI